jgi:pimeloyl-ACP methyl ester carboxylesterase
MSSRRRQRLGGRRANLFVPGWGATAGLYSLPAGWQALELPSYRSTRGELSVYRRWLGEEVARRRTPVVLAGHSMGGALALLAALDRPESVERLILLSPAGLPLSKPMRASAATSVRQFFRGCYPAGELWRVVAGAVAAPRAALRLARTVHDLDLTPELERIRASGVACTVVGCASDELTTGAHCRELATALGSGYREIGAKDGHIWPITEPELLAEELSR